MNYISYFIYFLIFLLLMMYIFLRVYYPKLRGIYGEKWVRLELEKLSKEEYVILNDIMLKDEFGTHQIDHIVISKKGIFVIEMKNYYGKIYGNQYSEKWTQYLGNHKNNFYSPIRQNYGHIKTLASLLNLDDSAFISIICFSNDAKLSIKSNDIVINLRNIKKKIEDYEGKDIGIDLVKCKEIILSNNIVDKKIKKEHIKGIKKV